MPLFGTPCQLYGWVTYADIMQFAAVCRLLRMTQAVEVLPSLVLAPSITMCPHNLHLDLLQLGISHCQVGAPPYPPSLPLHPPRLPLTTPLYVPPPSLFLPAGWHSSGDHNMSANSPTMDKSTRSANTLSSERLNALITSTPNNTVRVCIYLQE